MIVIRLSKHLRERVVERKIPMSLPRTIVKRAQTIYVDTLSKHRVAVQNARYGGKVRPMAAVFDKTGTTITIITVYSTNDREIASRVTRGRWIYEKATN